MQHPEDLLRDWLAALPEEELAKCASIRVAAATPDEDLRKVATLAPLYQGGPDGGYPDWSATGRLIVQRAMDARPDALKLRVWLLDDKGESLVSKSVVIDSSGKKPEGRDHGADYNANRALADMARANNAMLSEVRGLVNQLVMANEHLVLGNVGLMAALQDAKLEVSEQEAATLMLGAELEATEQRLEHGDPVKLRALELVEHALKAHAARIDLPAVVAQLSDEQVRGLLDDPNVIAKLAPHVAGKFAPPT